MLPAIIIIAIVVILVIALVAWGVGAYNGFIQRKNLVAEAWSTIDVQLKKRYDLIPNLVETVKGYAKHESGTLEKVIAARSAAMNATTGAEKIAAEKELNSSLRSIFILQESYPDLKANTNFLDLQNQLKAIETEIASARRYYNGTVKEFNTKIESFPSNLIAGMMKLKKAEYFEVDSAEERQNVKVQF